MKRVITITIASLVLSGCVSTKNIRISQQDLKQLNVNNVALTLRDKPDFAAMTAGKAMFALIGAVAMISAGNNIVQENEVEDPAKYIQAELAKELTNAYGFNINEDNKTKVETSKEQKLAKLFPESDLILDVETINWSFGYFPSDWNNYRVIYSAKLRLIDTKRSSTIAEGFCSRVPEESVGAPSHDELLANKAERLKNELKIAANQCISDFKANVLSINS